MRTITTTKTVYSFDELSKQAQRKAIEWYLVNCACVDSWWDYVYDDAKEVLLKITSFDIDRGNNITGEFIEDAEACARKIIQTHGISCSTYRTADAYMDQLLAIQASAVDGALSEDEEEMLEVIADEFLKDILEDYLSNLRSEYEYQMSEENAIESLEANEYEFTIEGNIA